MGALREGGFWIPDIADVGPDLQLPTFDLWISIPISTGVILCQGGAKHGNSETPFLWGSKAGGVIDESPGEFKFPAEHFGERFDPEGFCGVVAAVEDVDAEVLGHGMGPVGAFASDERIDAFGEGVLEFAAGAAGDDTDAATGLGAAWQEVCGGAGGLLQALEEGVAVDAGGGLEADLAAFRDHERLEFLEAKGLAEEGVITELGVFVEGEVETVDGEVVFEEQTHLAVACSGPGRRGAPKESVVNDEEVGPGLDAALDGGGAGIDGGGDFLDGAGVLDLEAVERAVPVGSGIGLEEFIAVADDGGEGGLSRGGHVLRMLPDRGERRQAGSAKVGASCWRQEREEGGLAVRGS
jgi:hypothetical protein